MDDNLPLIFTPLVRQPGVPIPDWLFGPAGVAGLPAPLSLPQGVNVAVGIDIIEVDRVRKVYEHHGERFLKRVFTEMEVRQCRGKSTRLAGRFAAKEAISKALGTGIHGVAWREMEVVQLRSGRPTVTLHGKQSIARNSSASAPSMSVSPICKNFRLPSLLRYRHRCKPLHDLRYVTLYVDGHHVPSIDLWQ